MENPIRRKIDKKIYIPLFLLFLIGLSILMYPTISNLWNSYRDQQLISEYKETVKQETDNQKEEMLVAARSYNKKIQQESVPDAFSVRNGVKDQEYEALLNLENDGMMGYIEIPVINCSIPIYHYTSEDSLKKGAGHLFGSSLPVGGVGTHCIISAHRGLPDARLFTDLNLVKKGDIFYLYVLDEKLAYQVDQILTVKPDETESLGITSDKDYVTLVTCTPYAVNTHRLLVRGHRISLKQAANTKQEQRRRIANPSAFLLIICVLAGIGIAILIVLLIKRVLPYWIQKRRKGNEGKKD